MTKKIPFWLIPVAIIVVLLCSFSGWGITTYNTLVASENAVDLAWNQVETQYQRRFDLIPNLVSTVKGYAQQEQEIFTKLAEARANYAGAKTTDEKAVAAGQVESSLGRLLVITENYPDLKSNQNFLDLSTELKGTENRIAVERSRYNEVVQKYNLQIKTFPNNILAGMFGKTNKEAFKATSGSETAPKVEF